MLFHWQLRKSLATVTFHADLLLISTIFHYDMQGDWQNESDMTTLLTRCISFFFCF